MSACISHLTNTTRIIIALSDFVKKNFHGRFKSGGTADALQPLDSLSVLAAPKIIAHYALLFLQVGFEFDGKLCAFAEFGRDGNFAFVQLDDFRRD